MLPGSHSIALKNQVSS